MFIKWLFFLLQKSRFFLPSTSKVIGRKKVQLLKLRHLFLVNLIIKSISGLVYEHVLGENKFTFVEECRNPQSVTILLKAPNKHSLTQMKVRLFDEFSRGFAIFFSFFAKKNVYGLCKNDF